MWRCALQGRQESFGSRGLHAAGARGREGTKEDGRDGEMENGGMNEWVSGWVGGRATNPDA